MSFLRNITICLLIFGCIISCDKTSKEFPLDVDFTLAPLDGQTTDTVIFKASYGSETNDLFYRWDWNADSIWDTEFSSIKTIKKRFLTPGEYSIFLQYADGEGNTRIVSKSTKITQGYSSPKPVIIISPPSGNFTNEFLFDASLTIDDEDSLNQLLFRWDFQGDGFWDTDFDSSTVATKKFSKAGLFNPTLEVKDPSKLIGSTSKKLEVHRTDTLIKVIILWSPEQIAVGDTIVFDVSSSQYNPDPDRDFKTSWLLPNNPVWSEPSYEKQLAHVFKREGKNEVGCKIIMDYSSLENTSFVEIFAAEENLPPVPSFKISIPFGNVNTLFYFDCWASRDDHLPTSQIFLRWDWDNDGNWDTPFSQDKVFYHQYTETGKYGIALQAMDNLQETATIYGQVTVSPYENPTGYFVDHRDHEIYGTVQIGSQWWMAENLRYNIPGKSKSGYETTLCLFEREEWCESVGKLYHVSSITDDRFDDKVDEVCPKGWRIPVKEDWEILIETLGGDGNAKELVFGGSADFNGKFLGYASFYIETEGMRPKDTIYVFHETYESMYYTSSSIAEDINEARTDIYMIKVSRDNGSLWKGYFPSRYYIPVRCIKE